ncbi:hypothetical protein H0H81_001069 [Sphagnurus paluster]|uniref:Nitronate monooxygenase domain-containing protein n=1 Tax=Sphagnurus paluster TaxID=117069 RepID=A0A9P7GNY7_9AGAR|nr:hypothetical protein H0H81_001069 [Sphagnurus paluster]
MAGYQSLEKLRSEVESARSILQADTQSPLPIGIGYLGWQLEKPNTPAQQLLSVALDNKVQAVWLSFGAQLQRWINFIRESEEHPGATKIFIQVTSLEEALVAINTWKADVIVAQGIEAGGHGSSTSPPLLTLVSEILANLSEEGPPILGAGGLVNGGHIAALLSLGASDSQRLALTSAGTGSSVRTMAFDHARNTLGWPRGIDGRGLRNSTVVDFENGVDIADLRRKYADGVKVDDPDRIVIWAGAGVGLMNKIQPAKVRPPRTVFTIEFMYGMSTFQEIVEEIHGECVTHIQSVASMLQ